MAYMLHAFIANTRQRNYSITIQFSTLILIHEWSDHCVHM